MLSNTNNSISSGNSSGSLSNSIETNTQLEQQFGYVEIPIELNYQLWQASKLTWYVSGGASTLFLNENNVQTISSVASFSNGEASNLNRLNFSFNIGTDVEYHFSEQWFLNINPILKIQTQTFQKTNNNPYLLGVSTGVNYKF